MGKRIPHIIDEDGKEKKLCSKCKQYKTLDEYNQKKDRADGLSNECFRCLSERNKRRHDMNFSFPEHVQTREEVQDYLDACRYKKQKDYEKELKEKGGNDNGTKIQEEN